jgi:hypothetical protein
MVFLTITNTISGTCGAHAATDWQIATDNSFNNIVAESLNDSINLLSISFDLDSTFVGQTLYARAKARGQLHYDDIDLEITTNCSGTWSAGGGIASFVYDENIDTEPMFSLPQISVKYGVTSGGPIHKVWYVEFTGGEQLNITEEIYNRQTVDWSVFDKTSKSLLQTANNVETFILDINNSSVSGLLIILEIDFVGTTSGITKTVRGYLEFDIHANFYNWTSMANLPAWSPTQPTRTSAQPVANGGLAWHRASSDLNNRWTDIYLIDNNGTVTTLPSAPTYSLSSGEYISGAELINCYQPDTGWATHPTLVMSIVNNNNSTYRIVRSLWSTINNQWLSWSLVGDNDGNYIYEKLVTGAGTNSLSILVTEDTITNPLPNGVDGILKVYYGEGNYFNNFNFLIEIPLIDYNDSYNGSTTFDEFVLSEMVALDSTSQPQLAIWGGMDGKIYICQESPNLLGPIIELDIVSETKKYLTFLPSGLINCRVTSLDRDNFIVFGRIFGGPATLSGKLYMYNIPTDTWTLLEVGSSGMSAKIGSLINQAMIRLTSGEIAMAGGYDYDAGQPFNNVIVTD